jgi:hypothetical protein
MKARYWVFALAAALLATSAFADQIFLKNGKAYSGKFLRGNSSVIEFQVLGRTESFNTSEVDRLLFQEPELTTPAPNVQAVPSSPQGQAAATVQAPATTTVVAPATPPAPQAADAAPPRREAPPQAATAGPSVTLPAGTAIMIRTVAAIDTDRNRVGDSFEATLDEAIMAGSQTIAPRGTALKGRISQSKQTGKVSGQSELVLELMELDLNGQQYLMRTSDYQEIGSSTGRRTATAAGGGAALGAIIGAIAGGGKGAAIGAGAGAAVGTGAAVMTRGQTLKIPAETILQFKLESPLTIPLQ